MLLLLHSAAVDAARGQVEVLLLLIVESVVDVVRPFAARVPESAVPEVSVVGADWHATPHVADGDPCRAAVLLLHGSLLDVVGEFRRGHSVRLFAVRLQLGGPELGLRKRSGGVGDGLVGPRSERSEPVHV